MRYARTPENDFKEFIRIYYEECRYRFGGIEAIAGKWTFRDLIPGMSDFDTRFVCRDDMTDDDWCEMSSAVGEAHLNICRKFPGWIRNLEHLPGINITWQELTSEQTYYPEYGQWMFYRTEHPEKLGAALEYLRNRAWDIKDEYFFLKKFCLYFGRYDRSIDPGCNMFPHENKYGLHSRLMHYFSPPIQSAMCLLHRSHIAGKFDAIELAQRRFPDLACWVPITEILHANYETPQWTTEPGLTRLEDMLEDALKEIAMALRDAISLVPRDVGTDVQRWKEALSAAPIDPSLHVFENIRFSRLMKGRLRFYARAPDYFDPAWPIENELARIGDNFLRTPLRIYWETRTGDGMADRFSDTTAAIDELRREILSDAETDAALEFARLTAGPFDRSQNRQAALAVAAVFDDFYKAISKLARAIRDLTE